MNRLRQRFTKEIIPAMKEKFGYKNNLQVPQVTRITLNSGIGQALTDEKHRDAVVNTLTRISGQKPVLTKAKVSIAAFKVREGMTVGVSVSMRGERMYTFLDKLINVALPRVRDFRGIDKKSVDATGNISIGFKEHIVFPEISSDEIERIHGLEVNITTSAKTREEGLSLLTHLGMPFKKEQ